MSSKLLNAILDGPFSLSRRPEPIPGDLRRSWGISLLVLILGKCRGKRASMQKIHFLAHSIRTEDKRATVRMVFDNESRPTDLLVCFEPWVNRAVAFAAGSGLLEIIDGKSVKLTPEGVRLFEVLYSDSTVFYEEKEFLDAISVKATEGNIGKIMRMEPMS